MICCLSCYQFLYFRFWSWGRQEKDICQRCEGRDFANYIHRNKMEVQDYCTKVHFDVILSYKLSL